MQPKRILRSILKFGRFAAGVTLIFAFAYLQASPQVSRTPVLLELFTSEGCSSCPAADQLLGELDQKQPEANAELVVLSEHVDYFNYLGWNDPFSASVFTERQEAISRRSLAGDIYTPQLVVDGRVGFVGSDQIKASQAIMRAIEAPKIPIVIRHIVRDDGHISVLMRTSRSVSGGRIHQFLWRRSRAVSHAKKELRG
jgi:hypothetical protein